MERLRSRFSRSPSVSAHAGAQRHLAPRDGDAGTGSSPGKNLISQYMCYNYDMIDETDKRPFGKLGDQQLLDQTRRLAANKRALEVHILDHLAEIDRRGLALRRGFSSLFDYAVRVLGFSDASAQRRIQTMRLCRRHDWVRADLQSGTLNLTSAAQWETAIARAERQSRKQPRLDGVRQRGEAAQPVGSWTRGAEGSDPSAPMASAIAPAQAPATRTGEPPGPADRVASVHVAVANSCVPTMTPAALTPIKPVTARSRASAPAGAAPTGSPQSASDTDDRGTQDSISPCTVAGSMLTKPISAQGGSPPADEDRALGGGQRLLGVVEARLRDDVHDRAALPIAVASAAATLHDPPATANPARRRRRGTCRPLENSPTPQRLHRCSIRSASAS